MAPCFTALSRLEHKLLLTLKLHHIPNQNDETTVIIPARAAGGATLRRA
jgi:hypothetical protein